MENLLGTTEAGARLRDHLSDETIKAKYLVLPTNIRPGYKSYQETKTLA
jgi:hypothetical protein